MRIGIDIRNIGKKRTGDEAVFLNLVKNLALIDNEKEYLLFTDIADGVTVESVRTRLGIENKKNFKIVSLPADNKFTWNFWTLPQYLRKYLVDVYHTQYILPFFVPKKTKLITHIHDLSFIAYPQFIKWIDLFFLKTLIPWSIRRADKIITVSEFTKKEIMKYYRTSENKIEVVYNSIGDNFNELVDNAKLAEVRKKYALPGKYLLYVGTLQPRKNIPFLIEAFAKAKEKLPGYKLVLAGAKNAHNYDRRIDEVIAKNSLQNEIIFPGYIESADLPVLYRLAQAFVFPSFYEGFGIPLLEATSQKIPVLASCIEVFQEVLGKGDFYFDPRSIDQLTQMLYDISINKSKRDELIEFQSSRLALFSWPKSAEKMHQIYKSLAQ